MRDERRRDGQRCQNPEIFPAPPVLAEVATAPAPMRPLDQVAPYVVCIEGPNGPDWHLTDDAVAFGPVTIVHDYLAWRATWVHTAELDPAPSLLLLADAFPDDQVAQRWARTWVAGEPASINDPADLIAQLDGAHRHVAARGDTGMGFIDASGAATIGLARTWSPAGGLEVLAAAGELRVTASPALGLGLQIADGNPRRVDDVREVVLGAAGVDVVTPDGGVTLDLHAARPLAWLMPGVTRWRVRTIPEVVVWAKTLSRLRQACELSVRLSLPLYLRCGLPVLPTDGAVPLTYRRDVDLHA